MTTISSICKLDDCLGSTVVKEFVVAPIVDEPLMRAMADGGRLHFFPDFPKPYFRIEKTKAYVVQGVIGNDRFRVTFSPSAPAGAEARLKQLIEGTDIGASNLQG